MAYVVHCILLSKTSPIGGWLSSGYFTPHVVPWFWGFERYDITITNNFASSNPVKKHGYGNFIY